MLLAKALKATEGVAGNKDVWVSISLHRLLLLYTLTLRLKDYRDRLGLYGARFRSCPVDHR